MRFTLFCVIAVCVGTLACTEDTHATDAGGGGALPACVERSERYDAHASFDYVEPTDARAASPCAATCDAPLNLDGYPSVAGLPAGKCSAGTQTCDMLAFAPYACLENAGPVNNYRCRCTDGRWHCDNIAAGARAHSCDADAGEL